MNEKEKSKEVQGMSLEVFVFLIISGFMLLVIMSLVWPSSMPIKLFELWHIKGSPWQWLFFSWPMFAWGAGLTAFGSIISRNRWEQNHKAEGHFAANTLTSVFAGVVEEIGFRWICFLCCILIASATNFLFFGFAGFGIPEWLQLHLFGPIADFLTLGHLHNVLRNPATWAIGAGLLAANAKFRDGHKYLGLVGYLNSWFIGMYLFVILFTYGLVACILVHFLYDFFIAIVRYVDMATERALGVSSDRPRRSLAVSRVKPRP